MSDDFMSGGVLPIDLDTAGDKDFDPNAVESDDFLPDEPDELIVDPDAPLVVSEEDNIDSLDDI
jgi:hypothetical protein